MRGRLMVSTLKPNLTGTLPIWVDGEDGESHQSVKLASFGLSRFKSYSTHHEDFSNTDYLVGFGVFNIFFTTY